MCDPTKVMVYVTMCRTFMNVVCLWSKNENSHQRVIIQTSGVMVSFTQVGGENPYIIKTRKLSNVHVDILKFFFKR